MVVPILGLVRARGDGKIIRYRTVGTGFWADSADTFVTAAHVLPNFSDNADSTACHAAISLSMKGQETSKRNQWSNLPASEWQRLPRNAQWFSFNPAACHKNHQFDVAVCKTTEGVPPHETAILSHTNPLPGTKVFFIGSGREGIENTTGVATITDSLGASKGYAIAVDRPAWTGASGSPVFASDEKEVVGMITRTGIGDASGQCIGTGAEAITIVLDEMKHK